MRPLLQIGGLIVLGIDLSTSHVWMVDFGEAVVSSVPCQLKIANLSWPDGVLPSDGPWNRGLLTA